jgi:hypothetical protein
MVAWPPNSAQELTTPRTAAQRQIRSAKGMEVPWQITDREDSAKHPFTASMHRRPNGRRH